MAQERLSKLQKWIITQCFKVTVLADRRELKELEGLPKCLDMIECPPNVTKKRNCNNDIEFKCYKYHCSWPSNSEEFKTCEAFNFYREDILYSYFGLEPCGWKYSFEKIQHFKDGPNNNKAYVTLRRSLVNLSNKGLIWGWYGGECSLRIELTDKGKQIALNLLGLDKDSINEPDPLPKEECQKQKENLERQAQLLERMLKR